MVQRFIERLFADDPAVSWTLEGMIHADGNYTVNITARVTDNGVLTVAEIAIGYVGGPYYEMEEEGVHRLAYEVPDEELSDPLIFYIHAEDDHGNEYTFVPNAGIPVVPY